MQFPVPVPDTGDLLFNSFRLGVRVETRIELFETGSNERVTILENAFLVGLTASHHLLFVKDDVLMAASFHADTHALGPAVPLSESIARDVLVWPQLAVAPVGTLAYVLAPGEPSPPDARVGQPDGGVLASSDASGRFRRSPTVSGRSHGARDGWGDARLANRSVPRDSDAGGRRCRAQRQRSLASRWPARRIGRQCAPIAGSRQRRARSSRRRCCCCLDTVLHSRRYRCRFHHNDGKLEPVRLFSFAGGDSAAAHRIVEPRGAQPGALTRRSVDRLRDG